MSFEDFIKDDKASSAVVRKLEIIGEAMKQLPEEVRSRFREIPWSSMAKTRDYIFSVDYKIIWKIIKEDLPPLKPSFEKIYTKLLQEEEEYKNDEGR